MRKILTIVGARPQFIKAAVVNREIRKRDDLEEIIIHTGQHYDYNMSEQFFRELDIMQPDYNLDARSTNLGIQSGEMIRKISEIIDKETPDFIMVYGDTTSTLAGAIAGVNNKIPVIHVEAGLRSYDFDMPEEINRMLTDKISKLLFIPVKSAEDNLKKEGIYSNNEYLQNIVFSGDVMFDATLYYKQKAEQIFESVIQTNSISEKYILATVHRAGNVDNEERLKKIVEILDELAEKVDIVLPLHPRTKKQLNSLNLKFKKVKVTEPLSYLETIALENNAIAILTDSGGVQRESFFLKKPCIILRDRSEWTDLTENGFALIGDLNKDFIIDKVNKILSGNYSYPTENRNIFGEGDAGKIIVDTIASL